MDACVVEVTDNPDIIEYKNSTSTLNIESSSSSARYDYTNDRLFEEAQKNPNSWLSKNIHQSTTILASNHLVRNLNINSTLIHFVK